MANLHHLVTDILTMFITAGTSLIDNMREIKFRAYDKKGRFDIASVLVIDFHEKYVVVDTEWNRDPETGESECVANFDEIELMQYTGLKDKKGEEIYEGDILEMDENLASVAGAIKEGKRSDLSKPIKYIPIEWADYGGFHAGPFNVASASKEGKIIGNIYENPALLIK